MYYLKISIKITLEFRILCFPHILPNTLEENDTNFTQEYPGNGRRGNK
jgi:hypothetical protein